MTPALTPWNAQWHVRAEMARLIERLAHLLARHRERGRTTDANAVGSLVIEPGEAEGLVADLAGFWSAVGRTAPSRESGSGDARREIWERADLGAAHGSFLPLRRAVGAFDLGPAEYDALLLALAVELDPRFGRLIAYLNDHIGHTRPTLGLAVALAEIEGEPVSPVELRRRPGVRDGLLELDGDGPVPGLAVRLELEMAARLTGAAIQAPLSPDVALHPAEAGSLERLVLAEPVRERLSQWSLNLRERRTVPVLVVAGSAGSGKTTAAVAACGEAGLAVVEVRAVAEALDARLRLARREARWYNAALLVKIESHAAEAMDWRVLWQGIQQVRTPILLELDSRTVEAAAASAPQEPVVISLEEPGLELRIRMWQSLLPRGEPFELSKLEPLAAAFRFPPGRISRAIRRAQAEMAALPPGQRRLTAASLENACRWIGSAAMGPLAQKLSLPYQMKDLVVPDTVRAELGLAVAWVRHQRQVVEAWGFARRIPFGRGLTALFSGPPGTGKTMAAQVLARELGLDIYRIDLSRVMNKYIGETEKNLARLFDEAHAAGVILFFDEADAIFGKRTEVRDAHDRYANVEIGYLLQRMEEHEGVTILATNRMRDMDEAFIRRFHFILNFPMPGEPDRLRIWQGMFPTEAAREANLDLCPLARHFEISGGEIRNVVLAAAFFAAAGNSAIGMSHLKRALRRELDKNGRVLDERALAAI